MAASDFFMSTEFKAYSEPCETSGLLANIVNGWKLLTLFEKSTCLLDLILITPVEFGYIHQFRHDTDEVDELFLWYG